MRLDRFRTALVGLALAAAMPAPAQTARPMLDYATAAKIRDGCLAWAGERKLTLVHAKSGLTIIKPVKIIAGRTVKVDATP